MPETISIITVALNSAAHVRNAMESIVAQDDGRLQYVVIDGASTDDTVAIVESSRPRLGDRLVVVSEKDEGLYDAMNKGVARATGDVVGILNSDDRYLPGTFAAVQALFASTGADIVYGDVEVNGPDGPELYKGSLEGIRRLMSMPHPGMFVRRSVYERLGGFDTRYRFAADYDFTLRCHLAGLRFVRLDRLVAKFEAGGLSSGSFEKRRRELYHIHRRQLGLPYALWVQAKVIGAYAFAKSRAAAGKAVLGPERYERMRLRWRRPSST